MSVTPGTPYLRSQNKIRTKLYFSLHMNTIKSINIFNNLEVVTNLGYLFLSKCIANFI